MNNYNCKDFSPLNKNSSSTCNYTKNNKDNIFTLANAFLSIESMTHKKLQKLCYYAKAWYLAINDRNLISEYFEAWIHGAVQPDLYQEYRCYGFDYIPTYNAKDYIPEEFLNFAREIYDSYGEFDGDELEKINHQEDPWINARRNLKPWQNSNNKISEDDMKCYYRRLMEDE